MIIKFIALAAVLFVIYIAFFKKPAIKEANEQRKNSTQDKSSDIMLECSQCSTFVSEKEAIIKDGKFFCSNECAKDIR